MDTPPSNSPSSLPAARPVFVDSTGRKLRLMRLVGAVALALVAGYLGVVGLAFLGGGPNAAAPLLPAAARPSPPASAPHPVSPTPAASPGLPSADEQTAAGPAGPAPIPAAQIAPAQSQAVPGTAAGGPPAAPAPASTAAAARPPVPTATQPPLQGNPDAPGQTRRATPTTRP